MAKYKNEDELFWEQMKEFDDAANGTYTEPADGKSYDYCGMIEMIKQLGRPLTEKEAEVYRMGSKVKDVFGRADIGGVVGAYLLTVVKPDGADMHPIQERMRGLDDLIIAIRNTIYLFRDCTPVETDEQRTVFVTENERTGWEERGCTSWECFSVGDTEAIELLAHNVVDKLPDKWCMADQTIEQMAGMRLAWPCEEEYGTEACCALILWELFAFGYTASAREKYFEWLKAEMEKFEQEDEPDEHRGFYDRPMAECKNEDERDHLTYWREYHSKVRDIEKRYAEQIKSINNVRYEKMLRKEYAHYFVQGT